MCLARARNCWSHKRMACHGSCPPRTGGGKLVHRLKVEQSRSQDDHGAGWRAGVRVERDPATGKRAAWWCALEKGRERGSLRGARGAVRHTGPWLPVPGVWTQSGKDRPCPSSFDLILTFSSMSVLVTSTSSAKPTSLSRLIPRPSLSKTFQVNRQPSSATVSRNWSSKVSNIWGEKELREEAFRGHGWPELIRLCARSPFTQQPQGQEDLILGKNKTGSSQKLLLMNKGSKTVLCPLWTWNLKELTIIWIIKRTLKTQQ